MFAKGTPIPSKSKVPTIKLKPKQDSNNKESAVVSQIDTSTSASTTNL